MRMKALVWKDEDLGANWDEIEIPDDLIAQAKEYQHYLMEAVAEIDDRLLTRYIEEGFLGEEDLKEGIRIGTINLEFTPVLCGSAFKNKGVQPLLDAVVDYLPSPMDLPPLQGFKPGHEDETMERKPNDDEPFSAIAFKIMSDPYVGKLTYFRVYSGTVDKGDTVMTSTRGKKERFGRLLRMHAASQEDIDAVFTGDIVAAIGMKATRTGDTLCAIDSPIVLESMTFPEPVISVAIEPKTKSDQEKLGEALQRLSEEDPTFVVHSDEETGQTIIAGMGELHLDVLVDRMVREFHVGANVGRPQVAYRETIKKSVEKIDGKYIKQSGGRGQY